MKKLSALFLLFVFCTSCKEQNKTNLVKSSINSASKNVITSSGANKGTHNSKQDEKSTQIASNGKTRMAPVISVLKDRKGNFWFGSVSAGVYYYDGISFRNFTIRDGLANDRVIDIYEDKTGNVWFASKNGVSRYDGKSFRNYRKKGGSPIEGC